MKEYHFPSRTFGLGSKYWIPLGWTVFGIGVLLLFSSSTRFLGIRMLFPGWLIAFSARANQFPLLTITSNTISLRKGITTDYHVFEKKDLLRIDMIEKAFTVVPKKGKPLKIPSWVFRKKAWKELQEPLREFSKGIR